jgi:hypothetical protein
MGTSFCSKPATGQDFCGRLPPSNRDFAVFEHVVIDCGTTRTAAEVFGISQTRVCQILGRVRDWLDEVMPDSTERSAQRQFELATALAGDRLDALYTDSLAAWRHSEGEVQRRRITASGDTITTTTTSLGDPKYLAAAGRLAVLRSKLATLGVFYQGMAKAADFEESVGDSAATQQLNHPAGACSENAECGVRNAELVEEKAAANRPAAKSSDPLTREQAAARRAFFGPVQGAEDSASRTGLLTRPS